MKPRQKSRPAQSPRRNHAGRGNVREDLRRQLLEKIIAWAEYHEECPVAGCRRNARCLKPDKCRVISDEPWTKEEEAEVRGRLEVAENFAEGKPAQ